MMAAPIARKISLKSQPVMNPTTLRNPLLLSMKKGGCLTARRTGIRLLLSLFGSF